jgi:hypothetical protein
MTSTNVIILLACISQAHAQKPVVRRGYAGPAAGTVRSAQSMQVRGAMPVAPAVVEASAATAPAELLPPAQRHYEGAVIQPAHHWERVPVIPGKKSASKFELVAFQGELERSLFQRIVSRFSCPTLSGRWSQTWWSSQNLMETAVLEDPTTTPVVAMKGSVPCAAAAFTDAHTNDQNTVVLDMLIRNAQEEQCVGGGAAILCHLIRNSQNSEGAFSPLRLTTNYYNEPSLKQYLREFGCTTTTRSESGDIWACHDPTPQRCEEFVGEGVDALSLQSPIGLSEFDQTSSNVVSAPAVMMIGFLAASGIMFRLLRLRNNRLIASTEALLGA